MIFKKVVHSLEPGETPSCSASHQALNYVQILKHRKIFKAARCGCGAVAFIISICLISVLYVATVR